jgi:hypothetical protein
MLRMAAPNGAAAGMLLVVVIDFGGIRLAIEPAPAAAAAKWLSPEQTEEKCERPFGF